MTFEPRTTRPALRVTQEPFMPDFDLTQALADLRCAGEEFTPAPSAREIVHRLRERGATVEATEGGFRVHPARLLTAEDRDAIAERLDDLVNLLHAERRPTVAPALRARAADLIALARAALGDGEAERMLGLFATDAGRAINEVENSLATRAAEGKVGDQAMAVFKWLLCRPGRVARIGEALNAFGDQHVLRGRDDSKEYAAEVERVALLLGELEDAGLAERQGDGLAAVLPEGVAS
jgi:hypothetical protein